MTTLITAAKETTVIGASHDSRERCVTSKERLCRRLTAMLRRGIGFIEVLHGSHVAWQEQ